MAEHIEELSREDLSDLRECIHHFVCFLEFG
jgi:hypothetical protein